MLNTTISKGTVYLVGAGPGSLDLITLRAKALIEQCDALVYDYLAAEELLAWTPEGCEQICVGKRAGFHSLPQEQIEQVLVKLAKEGKSVVRLKGGDPFVFGRGGEEIQTLKKNGIPFEIVPAVTAAVGAAAYTGIPLTARNYSSGVVFLTGHEAPDKPEVSVDWAAYASLPVTLCVYMGMKRLPEIVWQLMDGGRAGTTPVAVVQWATTHKQRSVYATLASICDVVLHEEIRSPAIVIIGEVARDADAFLWYRQVQ